MGNHTTSPERSGRLYFNDSYEDNPAAGPLAMHALSRAYLRRAALARATTQTIEHIDNTLGKTPPDESPPPESKPHSPEDAEEPIDLAERRRRKLGKGAVVANKSEPQAA